MPFLYLHAIYCNTIPYRRVFSSSHVTGEQLGKLTGVAAILRFPLPEIEDMAEVEVSDSIVASYVLGLYFLLSACLCGHMKGNYCCLCYSLWLGE